MKKMRMLGMATVAVLALTALVGTATAAASIHTTLCSTALEPCPAEYQDPPQLVEAASTKVTLATNIANVICGESALKAETTATEGTPLPVDVLALSLGGCHLESGSSCESTEKHAPGTGSLAWTAKNFSGEMQTAGGESGWRNKVKCSSIVNCEFTGAITMKTARGSLTATNVPLTPAAGLFCPKTATLSGTFAVSTPKPFDVSYAESPYVTTFCKTSANAPFCLEQNQYPAGTAFSSEASDFEISASSYPINCGRATISGALAEPDSEGRLPIKSSLLALSNCRIGISSTTCEATVSNNGSQWNVSWLKLEEGREIGDALSVASLSIRFLCGSNLSAKYLWNEPETVIANGGPATLAAEASLQCLEGNICSPGARMSATFTITAPNPLYVTHS
jgi:hypothetical protein